jgi:hypothetical protein
VEGRRQRLDAEELATALHLLEERAGAVGGVVDLVGRLQQAAADRGQPLVGGGHRLADRVDRHLVDGAQRALRAGVEEADRLDQVAEELDARRVAAERREEIEDAAADREGARVLHHRAAHEAAGE